MTDKDVFHAGERAVQARLQVSELAERGARLISDRLPKGALAFLGQQSLLSMTTLDRQGRVCASVLIDRPGFIRALNEQQIQLDLGNRPTAEQDPVWANLAVNNHLGMLVIDLNSRRRLRMVGEVIQAQNAVYTIGLEKAWPNCPKYIQRRHISWLAGGKAQVSNSSEEGTALGSRQCALIGEADTFFVASAHPEHGPDASHRGGKPGFVRVLDARTLRIPDYSGNNFYNTLGNIALNPRIGLSFIDFTQPKVLQIFGNASIEWRDETDVRDQSIRCFWQVEIVHWRELPMNPQVKWEFLEYSPHVPDPNELP